jgi:protein-S-isoprenylcysteine O-methyltransferase Ste14
MNILGAIIFVFLFLVRLEQGGFGLPLAAQSALAACLLVFARAALSRAPVPMRRLAWLSVFVPMGLQVESPEAWAGLPGLLLSMWAMASLGLSFSIEPTDRGLVQCGPYRWLRHPMYAGELLSCLGVCAVQPSLLNVAVVLLFMISLIIRIRAEEGIVAGYGEYAKSTRWRLIPRLW